MTDPETELTSAADGAALEYKAVTRLYVADDLAPGATVRLDRDRDHYLRHVLRQQDGAPICIFNGRDGEWAASLSIQGKSSVLRVGAQTLAQRTGPDLWLVFAPIKGARMDNIIEKATELGVSRLQPVLTERTQIRRVNPARWTAQATEAAEQSLRLDIPQLGSLKTLPQILAEWPSSRRLLLCAEAGSADPIESVLRAARDGGDESWAVLTGPEGGFSRHELDALHKLPFVSAAGLGPRILRADTAAIAALACLQAIRGDWAKRPPQRTSR